VVVVIAVVLLVIFVKPIRTKVLPYRDRKMKM